jgi:hypothetical protein
MTKESEIVKERCFFFSVCMDCTLGAKRENLLVTQSQRARSLGDGPSSGKVHVHDTQSYVVRRR